MAMTTATTAFTAQVNLWSHGNLKVHAAAVDMTGNWVVMHCAYCQARVRYAVGSGLDKLHALATQHAHVVTTDPVTAAIEEAAQRGKVYPWIEDGQW